METAVSWEASRTTARGLPSEVIQILDSHHDTSGAILLLGLPEHRVQIPGGGHQSQTDLWALLRRGDRLVSLAVEGKSGESFDKTVGEWLSAAKPNSGKPERLAFLRQLLGLSDAELTPIRYQLLHRAGSAIIEAQRFCADSAIFLVQAFGGAKDYAGFADFQGFARLLSVEPEVGTLYEAKVPGQVRLLLGWVNCECAGEAELEAAV